MSSPCFLIPAVDERSDEVVVAGDEGYHAVSVKRMRVGEAVLLSDGGGVLVSGVVSGVVGRDVLRVSVVSIAHIPRSRPLIHIALGLLKGERMDRAVEQLTEVGVARITPLLTEFCVSRPDVGAAGRATGRWARRAREAAKQSRRAWVPEISDVALLDDFAEQVSDRDRTALVLDPDASNSIAFAPAVERLMSEREGAGEVVLVVGPEGGLSAPELRRFGDGGAVVARLGPEVMRSGTAALAGAVAVSILSGRWHT